MASGGHPHPTLTMHPSYSGEEATSSSPLAVWTAQVPALSANGSDLCWQMVENGQHAVQQQRRRHTQKLFHFGRTLLLKHLPRDVNEHVSHAKKHVPSFCISCLGFTTLGPPSWPSGRTWEVVFKNVSSWPWDKKIQPICVLLTLTSLSPYGGFQSLLRLLDSLPPWWLLPPCSRPKFEWGRTTKEGQSNSTCLR